MSVQQPEDDAAQRALSLRASDADRERVAEVLRQAYAEGRLTAVEMQERLGEAYAAQTYADLVPVLRELPFPPGTVAVPGASPGPSAPAPRVGAPVGAEGPMVAIFGGFTRKGAWTVPAEGTATCILGGGELDFREAVLTSRETVLTTACILGGLEITVPEGMAVRSEVVAILGGVELPPSIAVAPDAPVLVLKGVAILGGVEVKRR
jgi:hypothetical protein